MSTTELKPCPFCGEAGTDSDEHPRGLRVVVTPRIAYVNCRTCGTDGPIASDYNPTASEAAHIWNEGTHGYRDVSVTLHAPDAEPVAYTLITGGTVRPPTAGAVATPPTERGEGETVTIPAADFARIVSALECSLAWAENDSEHSTPPNRNKAMYALRAMRLRAAIAAARGKSGDVDA